MVFDYRKLKGRIVEKCGSISQIAKELKLTSQCLSAKLNNHNDFSSEQIYKLVDILEISESEVVSYFFTPKVAK